METINTIELNNELVYPNDVVLESVLGEGYAAYKELLVFVESLGLVYEWRYYKDGKAWLCKVQKKKKTILWMSAWKGFIQVCVYMPLKYWDKIDALDLSPISRSRFAQTKTVGKSKPCIFEMSDLSQMADLHKVIAVKMTL